MWNVNHANACHLNWEILEKKPKISVPSSRVNDMPQINFPLIITRTTTATTTININNNHHQWLILIFILFGFIKNHLERWRYHWDGKLIRRIYMNMSMYVHCALCILWMLKLNDMRAVAMHRNAHNSENQSTYICKNHRKSSRRLNDFLVQKICRLVLFYFLVYFSGLFFFFHSLSRYLPLYLSPFLNKNYFGLNILGAQSFHSTLLGFGICKTI